MVEKQKTVFPPLLAKPFGFCTVSTGPATMNIKQRNRTLHLLQKPDIFICYRQSNHFFSCSIAVHPAWLMEQSPNAREKIPLMDPAEGIAISLARHSLGMT